MKHSLEQLYSYLNQFLNFEKTPEKNIFWLKTMDYMADLFDKPQENFKSFHIAGSKGKGSVAAMFSSVLTETNFLTGLYTSPHILHFSERFTKNGSLFSDDIYKETTDEFLKKLQSWNFSNFPEQRKPTWFELVTLYSFYLFSYAKCQYAVYETGLGGRLDSTNILKPIVSVITHIEKEHTEFLGDTLEKIAQEKAGIIKENTPVFLLPQEKNISKVFKEKAAQCNAPIFFLDDYLENYSYSYTQNGMNIHLEFSDFFSRPLECTLKLPGKFQLFNAALVALTIKKLFPSIDESSIERGLAKAFIPGRFEIIKDKNFTAILDGAHTPHSIRFTLETLQAMFPQQKEYNLLFACAADKNIEEIAQNIKESNLTFSKIFITKPGNFKATKLNLLEENFTKIFSTTSKITCDEDFVSNIKQAISISKQDNKPLLVTGSFYLLAEFKKNLQD